MSGDVQGMDGAGASQDERYQQAAGEFGPAVERLAHAYEADPQQRRDLVQDIHFALWRSLAGFENQCSLRTWVYRVAHNAAASHVRARKRRRTERLTGLEELESAADGDNPEDTAGERQVLARLVELIQGLKSPDREVMLLYLEGLDAATIAEVTGLSSGAVATKIHRAKAVLAQRFNPGRAK